MVGRWLLGRRRAESWRSGDSQKEQDGKYVDEPRGSTWMDGNGLIEVMGASEKQAQAIDQIFIINNKSLRTYSGAGWQDRADQQFLGKNCLQALFVKDLMPDGAWEETPQVPCGAVLSLPLPERSSQSSPRMLSGIPFSTSSRVFSVRYMQIPCPYSAK